MDIWLFALVFAAVLSGWLLGRWQPFRKKVDKRGSDYFSERYAKAIFWRMILTTRSAFSPT